MASLFRRGGVSIYAILTDAIAQSIVASTWTRRMLLSRKLDIDCYPFFKKIHDPQMPQGAWATCFTMAQRNATIDLNDRKARLALRPIPFISVSKSLPTAEEAFSESVDVDLPIVKIGSETHPNRSAHTMITFLRSCGGVQVFSSGCEANHQALKSITLCRNYVRELPGHDLGFQCIHAPRENRDGACQVVTWIRLTTDMSPTIETSEEEKIQFRIGNTNDAKTVGIAMASQIEHCSRLDCLSEGVSGAARSLVAVSHARLYLAAKGLDCVAIPKFEEDAIVENLEHDQMVRLRFDVFMFKKRVRISP